MKKNDHSDNQNEISELQAKVSGLNEKYLRALADYQNLEKQTEVWRQDFVQFANFGLIARILEILDDLEKAGENIKDDGLNLIISKFKKVLESEGLEELKLEGQTYDPSLAEVISMQPGEKDNVIIKVLQKGYKIKDKIVRPGKVIVSKI